LHYLIINYIIY